MMASSLVSQSFTGKISLAANPIERRRYGSDFMSFNKRLGVHLDSRTFARRR